MATQTVVMDGERFSIRITLTTSQDVGSNKTTVTVTKLEIKANQGDAGSMWLTGTIKINNASGATLILSSTTSCSVSMSSSWSGGGAGWSGWSSLPVAVTHGTDGSGQATITASIDVMRTSGAYLDNVAGSYRAALPDIPRSSTITAQGGALGQQITVTIKRASSKFRDTITWKFGSRSGTIVDKTAGTTAAWTPEVSLAEVIPAATSGSCELTVTTYNGTAKVGESKITITLTVPEDIVPQLEPVVTDVDGHMARYGSYIQGASRILVAANASGVYGSTITAVVISLGGVAAAGETATIKPANPGQQDIVATAVDSRGRSARWSTTITAAAYTLPAVEIEQMYRCSQSGQSQQDGGFCKIIFRAEVEALGDQVHYSVLRRIKGSDTWTVEPIPDYDGQHSITGGEAITAAASDMDWEIAIAAEDAIAQGTSQVMVLSVAFALLDFDRTRQAIGIGMRAQEREALNVGVKIVMHDTRITGLAAGMEDTDAVTLGQLKQLLRSLGISGV